MRIYYRKYLLTLIGNMLDALGPIIVLVFGGYLVLKGRTEVSTLVVFISGLQRVSDPWDQLVTFYRTASNAQVSYGLIIRGLATAPLGPVKPAVGPHP
jgi:ABC-type bacteriocin/lantibiotic exporter with double-glycine peptidase domain